MTSAAGQSPPGAAGTGLTTVRLAFMRRFPEAFASGLLLGMAGRPVVVFTGASKHLIGWLVGAACVER